MCFVCQLPTNHAVERQIIAAYVDPGTGGYVVQSIIPAILGFFSTILASMFFFFRKFFRPFLKKWLIILILLAAIAGIIVFAFQSQSQKSGMGKKVIVLAFDGLDPNLLSEGIEKGKLPNFKKLKGEGYYSPLQTTIPPQSPVAWASFTTADSPAKHTIYDFIKRDPNGYKLDLTFSQNNQWVVAPFWDYLSKKGISSTILFLPNTFPPSSFEGKMLSGMGVPDILGTQGTLTLFTTRQRKETKNFRGKIISVDNKDLVQTSLEGPKYRSFGEEKKATIPIEIIRDAKKRSVAIKVGKNTISLKERAFSDWVPIEFKIDVFTKVGGMVKFYAKETGKELELYISPINFDPKRPFKPISNPKDYSKQVALEYGLYSTLGLPRDTWALEQDIFDEDAFLLQSDSILSERKKMYFGELKKFKNGLFFGYFGFTDILSHMFWRFLDDPNSKYNSVIMNMYTEADKILGETLKSVGKDDTLVVLSDHGFGPFTYEINLNSWLRENGYLVLKEGKEEGSELLLDVDWSKTKAYAIGYNSLYLNLKGRESEGIVGKAEARKLEKELREKLLTVVNPFTDSPVIKKVYTREELGIKESDTKAPDLFIGYYKGIRSSWDTAVGATPKDVIKKRTGKWSGDHLFDPSEVPGILFINNKKISAKDPRIEDVVPTVLEIFGVAGAYEGKSLLPK